MSDWNDRQYIDSILDFITKPYNGDRILKLLFLNEIRNKKAIEIHNETTEELQILNKINKSIEDIYNIFDSFMSKENILNFNSSFLSMSINAFMYNIYTIDNNTHECCKAFICLKILDRYILENKKSIIPSYDIYSIISNNRKELADLIADMGYMKKHMIYIEEDLYSDDIENITTVNTTKVDTDFVNIGPISPDEAKDIASSYDVNQITKKVEILKTDIANSNDDKSIEEKIEEEFEDPNKDIDYQYKPYEEKKEEENKEVVIDQEYMINKIKDIKICIVGGHVNWLNKIKEIFPNWAYVDKPRQDPVKKIANCKAVYFFTEHLDHCLYEKYIAAARNAKEIFVGYIHNVNLDSGIKQIYDEVAELA